MHGKDLKQLRKMVKRLGRVPEKKLVDAVCDIIDLKGYSLAVILRHLPEFSADRQLQIVRKIEDFLYFHPEKGVRLFSRLKRAFSQAHVDCRPNILSAMVDVAAKMPDGENRLSDLIQEAQQVILMQTDLTRKGKAIEILARSENRENLLEIIKLLIKASEKIAEFENYQFVENCLLVIKKLGGESVIRLLINPNSDNAVQMLRLEWKSEKPEVLTRFLKLIHSLDSYFAQTLLKVIDYSDFNLPFVSMIREGMSHEDKWVRQAAVASMEKVAERVDVEDIARMLSDSSPEVRLMAISSLGGYSAGQTGTILEMMAREESETIGSRMNALYALHSQKNLDALERLSGEDNPKIALNAMGLAALLKPRSESFEKLLDVYVGLGEARASELEYYLMELSEPEDLPRILDLQRLAVSEVKREGFIRFLRAFLSAKSGPRLDRIKSNFKGPELQALRLLSQDKLEF
ncbi:MAG: hypothetical protein Kow0029_22100 [Candidatus Rifleibacteriota bacterium]